jgi:CRISPR-associated protein Csm4
MQLFKTTVEPISNFAANLRGDTLFGQLCWMIRFCFGDDRLTELLASYDESPFLIVSDAFAQGYLPKPKLPFSYFADDNGDKKSERKKAWIKLEDLQTLTNACELKDDLEEDKTISIVHNSINYATSTTDDSNFAPYGSQEFFFGKKDIYCLIDEERFSLEELTAVFEKLQNYGYGKDSSIGKGRFTFLPFESVADMLSKSNSVMALSPFSPQGLACKKIYYDTFTRFGKKGAFRSSENPFKKPLLLADTASVIAFDCPYEKSYIGKAIRGHSTHSDIVHQGYAITVAIKEI